MSTPAKEQGEKEGKFWGMRTSVSFAPMNAKVFLKHRQPPSFMSLPSSHPTKHQSFPAPFKDESPTPSPDKLFYALQQTRRGGGGGRGEIFFPSSCVPPPAEFCGGKISRAGRIFRSAASPGMVAVAFQHPVYRVAGGRAAVCCWKYARGGGKGGGERKSVRYTTRCPLRPPPSPAALKIQS